MSTVGKKCDPTVFLNAVIIPISTKLVTDPSVHVRASLAEGVCMIAEILG
jgi:hypothetical protein